MQIALEEEPQCIWFVIQSFFFEMCINQAAVLEYICAEILELSGNSARDNKRHRIKARDIQLAVGNDEELSKLMKNAYISNVWTTGVLEWNAFFFVAEHM